MNDDTKVNLEYLPLSSSPIGIEFTETACGYISSHVKDGFEHACEMGQCEDHWLEWNLDFATDDVDRAVSTPSHAFSVTGTVRAPSLSAEPLAVSRGAFRLLARDSASVGVREMAYEMILTADDGRAFYCEAFKRISRGLPSRLWPEASTIFVTVYTGEAAGRVLAKGVLRISPSVFAQQLSTVHATGPSDAGQRLRAEARLGDFLAGALWDTYGGVLSRPHYFNPDAPLRRVRPLRAPAPEVIYFTTADGVQLRLLRYQGGRRGPVILSHGIGVSSLIFRTDTLETNLVEFLVARGFDVWALDYRGSIELAASSLQFTADDVAAYDYPAALAKVRELTGAASVQMVVHCFGSVSFFMAMLKGLQGVRSVVSSQVATHLITAPITGAKCGLYIPEFLNMLGFKSLNAFVDDRAGWDARLYETAMRLYPMPLRELCANPVCHRITFMYSQVFEHQQLSGVTHDALHEMFGFTNIRAFEHLACMVRRGHIVTAGGENAYLPHIERLSIPIAFVHGGKNRCFLPASTEATYDLLCRRNGKRLYTRHVIPHYGHADSILGKHAARDVYPVIAKHLLDNE